MFSPVIPPRPSEDDSESGNSTGVSPSISAASFGISSPGSSSIASHVPLPLTPSIHGAPLIPYGSAAPQPPVLANMQGYPQQSTYFTQYPAAMPVMQTVQYVPVPQVQPGFATTPILHPQQGLPGMMTTQMPPVPLPVAVQPAMPIFQQAPYLMQHQARSEQIPMPSKWAAGPNYGPVHDARMATLLNPTFEVNPILRHLPSHSDENRLEYNVLFSLSTATLFKDKQEVSWVDGRDEPVVLPRLETLTLVSHRFPWMIHVKASDADCGVTCADVMEALHKDLHKTFNRDEVNSWSRQRLEKISAVYHYNRQPKEGVPGGALGKGFRRVDYLSEYTIFDGLEYDEALARERFGYEPVKTNQAGGGRLGPKPRKIHGVFTVKFTHNNGGKEIIAPKLANDWRFPNGQPLKTKTGAASMGTIPGATVMPPMGHPSPLSMPMGLPQQPIYQPPQFPPQPLSSFGGQYHQQPQYYATPLVQQQGLPVPVGYIHNPAAPVQTYGGPIPMSPPQPVIPNRKKGGGLFSLNR